MNKYIATHIYPLFYFLFWFVIHFSFLGYDVLFYSAYISLAYATGHFITARNGKVALSSDGVTLPLVAMAGIIYALMSWYFGHLPADLETAKHNMFDIINALLVSYLGAHLCLLLIVSLYSKLFESV